MRYSAHFHHKNEHPPIVVDTSIRKRPWWKGGGYSQEVPFIATDGVVHNVQVSARSLESLNKRTGLVEQVEDDENFLAQCERQLPGPEKLAAIFVGGFTKARIERSRRSLVRLRVRLP